jgi:hypothetical protein
MKRPGWLGLWLLQACTGNLYADTFPSTDLNAVELDAGESTALQRTLDASGDSARARDAARGDSAMDLGAPDGGSSTLPTPAAPCDDDLSFVGGTVQPDVGPTSNLDDAARDLEQPGRFDIFERDVRVPLQAETRSVGGYAISITAGELSGTIYGPSDDGGKSLAAGRFPLVIGAPGFQAGYQDYAGFFRHFASHGFVVLGIQTRGGDAVPMHDQEAVETSQAISYMLTASAYREQVDPEKVAAVGHSKGGKVSFFAAALDARIDLVVGWDPSNAGGPPCGAIADLAGVDCNLLPVAPNCLAVQTDPDHAAGILQYMHAETLVFGVPPDALANPTPEHNSLNFYRGAPAPASLVYFEGSHTAWVEGGFFGLLANPDIIRVTKAVQTAKMLTLFQGATGLDRYLPGGAYLTAQRSLVRQVASK